MHIISSIIFLFILSNAYADDASQLVAEVNGNKIYMSDLTKLVRKELGSNFDSFNKSEQQLLLKTSMEKLIERKVLLQEAEKLNMLPTTEQVETFIATINSQLGDTSSVKKEVEKHGVAEEDFKNKLREELAIKNYLDQKVFTKLEITGLEIAEESKKYKPIKQVCARYAEFKLTNTEQNSQTQERANKALALVRENQDFADVARKFSDASNKAKGGDLGCFTENQLPNELSKIAFSLAPGQVSDLVQDKNSFFFLKVEKINPPVELTKEELNERSKQTLLRAKREELLTKALEKLKKKSKIIKYFN